MASRNPSIRFEYTPAPVVIDIDRALLRATLEKVRDQLLTHQINGGGKKLTMDSICQRMYDRDGHACGMAACIGGWTSLFLLGFDGSNPKDRAPAVDLFGAVQNIGGRYIGNLFYGYDETENYNEPNIAATAIQRYLDGDKPWPRGKMPDVLRYKRRPVTRK